MAGALHGVGEPDTVINVGVSGPGVVAAAIREAGGCNFSALADTVKKIAFKITRVGQLIAAEAASDPDSLKTAPHTTPVRRLDETTAARQPVLRYKDMN